MYIPLMDRQYVTRRLASNNPNLQNIPVRSAKGREIRKALCRGIKIMFCYLPIIPRLNYLLWQLSVAMAMREAFNQEKIYMQLQRQKVYGVEETAVTKEQRYKAKSVNFVSYTAGCIWFGR